ncbi:MAG: carboxypeptidase-like regulatory domain-containing protein [Terracidiphilus sp.]
MALFGATVGSAARTQLESDGPIRLTSVEGVVVDTFGKPAANVNVTLSRDNKVLLSTHTDQKGAFEVDHASGEYLFRVERSANAPAAHQIAVHLELVTLVQRKKLYVILGPGACMDACSSIFTTKQEFDKALRKLNRH